MRVLVITPTYNERDNLEAIIEAVLSSPVGADYMIVDDNSPDGTGDLADQIAAEQPRLKVHHRAGKLGLGSAYREAFGRAAEPREVANVMVFLASDLASYMTGEVVSVSSQHP